MNKRKSKRVLFYVKAKVNTDNQSFFSEVTNISMKGIYLETIEKLEINSLVDIALILTGASSDLQIDISGKVVRHDQNGIGIEFTEIDLDAYIHLKNVVTYNLDEENNLMNELIESGLKCPE